MKTVAIDFDGVIHKYSKGWQDGKIYDDPIDGALDAIRELQREGYAVFILSTRSPSKIKRWLEDWTDEYDPMTFMRFSVVPFWKKFWSNTRVVGITNRKLAAAVYIDDRAILFEGDWHQTMKYIRTFKTWQQR